MTVGTNRVVAYTGDGVERWWVSGLTEQPINLAVTGSDLLFASMQRIPVRPVIRWTSRNGRR